MEVLQPRQDLARKALRHILVEPPILPQNPTDTSTRNVLQEDTQERRRLLEAKVLHDIRMIQIFQGFTLELERLDDVRLSCVAAVGSRTWYLDLFDGDHLSCGHVHGEVDAPEVALADQLAAHPLEDCYKDLVNTYS